MLLELPDVLSFTSCAFAALFTQMLIAQGHPVFFCFTLVTHYHGRGTGPALSALPPRRGSKLGGASRPSRPCCLPEGSVEALATRSAHEPNELGNRLGHSGGAHDLRWEVLG